MPPRRALATQRPASADWRRRRLAKVGTHPSHGDFSLSVRTDRTRMERPMTAVGRAAARQTPPAYACKLPSGEICVTQEPSHQLLCLTLSGDLRNVVDPCGELLRFPTGIACDGASLFVADGLADRVHRLRLPDFKPCASTSDSLQLHYVHGICLHRAKADASGDVSGRQLLYLTDWGHHRIVALDPDTLSQSYTFGSKGRGPGQFMYPRGISSLPGDRLLVSDTDNHRLQIVEARTGTCVREILGIEQPYAAVGAPGPGGEGLAFVATMGGRLCILPIHEGAHPGTSAASVAPDRAGLTKEVAMPSGGRLLCGICADERRVLVAGLDEDRQLFLLAARPSSLMGGESSSADSEREGRGRPSGLTCAGRSGDGESGGARGIAPSASTGGGSLGLGMSSRDGRGAGGVTSGATKGCTSSSRGRGVDGASPSRPSAASVAAGLLSLPQATADILILDPARDVSAGGDVAGLEHVVQPGCRRPGSARAGRRALPPTPTPPVQLE